MDNQEKKALELQKDLLGVLEKHGCKDFIFIAGFRNTEQTYIHGIVGLPSILVDMTQDLVERQPEAVYIFKHLEI